MAATIPAITMATAVAVTYVYCEYFCRRNDDLAGVVLKIMTHDMLVVTTWFLMFLPFLLGWRSGSACTSAEAGAGEADCGFSSPVLGESDPNASGDLIVLKHVGEPSVLGCTGAISLLPLAG